MGGPGSGNAYRWGAKASTGACDRFDVTGLYRGGWLRPGAVGSARWERGGRVTSSIGWAVVGEDGAATAVELRYAAGGEEVRTRVALAWTACYFGGQRPWFVCPGAGCGRRAAVLYGGRFFRCRRCHGLAYESTRQSPGERALGKAQRIRVRLGGTANMLEPFPSRPKGMHRRTYERVAREAAAAERAYGAEAEARMAGMEGELARRARKEAR